ncbi:MAG: hypothetical protein ACFBSC_14550 [Microcoleaceae cyanobacterium]
MILIDNKGVIHQAVKVLPESLRFRFLEILSELEMPEAWENKHFPKTELRRVPGLQQPIYSANIDARGAWKLYLEYADEKMYLSHLTTALDAEGKPESIDLITNLNEF